MGIFGKLFGTKATTKRDDVEFWKSHPRQLATVQLVTELETLLVEGYENDPSIRAHGPLGEGWPNAIAWFGASQVRIVTDFIRRRRIWEDDEAEAIARCRSVIHAWCVKHGATVEELQRCENLLAEGLQRFGPILTWSSLEEIQELRESFLKWAESLPEIRENFSRISLFLADDGLVGEYLGSAKALFNDSS